MEDESSSRSRFSALARRLRWNIGLILFAALPSCGVAPTPVSYEGRMISKVIIRHKLAEDANRENDGRLRNYMTIREGKPYSYELADDTIRSLWESGYVDDARLLVEEDGKSIRVFVEVEDRPGFGPCPSIMGSKAFSDLKLWLIVKDTLTRPITESQVEFASQKLEQFYRRHGYKQVSIAINYERWGKRSIQSFTLEIEEGPRTPSWYEGIFRSPEKATAP